MRRKPLQHEFLNMKLNIHSRQFSAFSYQHSTDLANSMPATSC